MTTQPPAYDEVGSRTRQAWLRTSLGVIAVTLLVLRSLLLADADTPALLAGLIPAAIFTSIAVRRTMQVRHGESERAAGATVAWVLASVAGLVTVGIITVLGT